MAPNVALKLYGSPHSQFTYKVALALRLSGTPFHFRYVNFSIGEHRQPWFLELSRWGQVPVLTDDWKVLVQSGAILQYLSEELGLFALSRERASRVREWLFWNADRLAPPIYRLYGLKLQSRGLLANTAAANKADETARALAAFDAVDVHLARSDFLTGDDISVADLSCYAEVAFARLCELDLGGRRNLFRWSRRIESLPNFAEPLEMLAREDMDFE